LATDRIGADHLLSIVSDMLVVTAAFLEGFGITQLGIDGFTI